ncbi:COG1496: Uncharacterized conserved protein [hydrothermal vent metagenome]|uniref:COG1496: Uncharacterized conserved protein n=1 Tax=hydrothermal vent metagenome TaxID=652676 RepID=A0A1W1BMN0_9ZZZZ
MIFKICNSVFPNNVLFFSTPKIIDGGFSTGEYDNFNLAVHTNDNLDNVINNRQLLIDKYNLPNEPKWLNQIHSDNCVIADELETIQDADASITRKDGIVCAVLTADCLPIFATDKIGGIVGVCHAGWQGILNGVIENFIEKMQVQPENILIHFGVAIGQQSLELNEDIYQQFIKKNDNYQVAFMQKNNKYYLDIYQIATLILNSKGVKKISGGGLDTKTGDYFSYRRQGANSGRHAHLIWKI